MRFSSVPELLKAQAQKLASGPLALIFAEDAVALEATLAHHAKLGFANIILCAAPALECDTLTTAHIRLDCDTGSDSVVPDTVNALLPTLANTWIYAGYNAEFLHYPFHETRNIRELVAFIEEERRYAVLSFAVDLYASDLGIHPNAVDLSAPCMDSVGYHAQARRDPKVHNFPKERQLDFHGGLRWRFEEHIPKDRRRIDRVALFKAGRRAKMRADFTFTDEEMNTYACKWHNNLTATVLSFRTAKALMHNPGSSRLIETFHWTDSVRCDWSSRQLMDLGLMEPGQWF